MFVPQIQKEIVEVIQLIPQERISERIKEKSKANIRLESVLEEEAFDFRGCGDVSVGGGELGRRSWSSETSTEKKVLTMTLDAEVLASGVRTGGHGVGARQKFKTGGTRLLEYVRGYTWHLSTAALTHTHTPYT